MALTTPALTGQLAEVLAATSAAISNDLRVALPGIIQSFDPETVTCAVAPAIKGARTESDGSVNSVSYPLLVDVPVIFPRGGGCTLTFPVAAGDECLLIFADRAIDFWWQSGSTQEPVNTRQHSLSDAFVIPGPQSQVKKISGISTTAAQLRSDDGAAFVEVAAAHDITLTTPGKLTAQADGGTEITSPTIVLNGAVTINGSLNQGKGSAGGGASLLGPVTVDNDVSAAGISLKGHVHSGVQSGGGKTGGPQ
ncbi:MAG TPA: Gp138 family membrane-puncturing spike protein [Buttiauxella sp.]|jgi:phage baseplate assembly protein gpV